MNLKNNVLGVFMVGEIRLTKLSHGKIQTSAEADSTTRFIHVVVLVQVHFGKKKSLLEIDRSID